MVLQWIVVHIPFIFLPPYFGGKVLKVELLSRIHRLEVTRRGIPRWERQVKNFTLDITFSESHPSDSQLSRSSRSEPLPPTSHCLRLLAPLNPQLQRPSHPPAGPQDPPEERLGAGSAHARPVRGDWSVCRPGWRHHGAPLPGVLARSLCPAGARVSDRSQVGGRAVSSRGTSGDMTGYTPDEKLRLQQLRELRRRWLKDQELSPREPVLPPQRMWPVERFWNKFLQDPAPWKNLVSDRPPSPAMPPPPTTPRLSAGMPAPVAKPRTRTSLCARRPGGSSRKRER